MDDNQPKRNEKALTFKDGLSHKPVVCTAGRSYYVIRSKGDIYRCLYNPQLLGHMQDGVLPQLDGAAMACMWKNSHDKLVDSCHPSGDLMFATTWERDDDGNLVKEQAPWSGSRWSEPEDPIRQKPCSNMAFFQVLPVNAKCNFACAYCCNFYYEDENGKIIGRPKDHDADLPLFVWHEFLNACSAKLDFAHFGFLGGEPTLYSHMADLTNLICNDFGWEVGICSNMSLPRVFEKIVSGLREDKKHLFRVSASLHPFSKNFKWENYWESCKLLRDAGIVVRATMVSWPEQTFLHDEYKAQLETIGVHLHMKGIGGYDIPNSDWGYIADRDGTLETPEYLKKIGWI